MNRQHSILIAILFVLSCGVSADQPPPKTTPKPGRHTMLTMAEMKWIAAPNYLPRGAQIASLHGSMERAGMFVVQIKFPANYRIPAHRHSADEHITVLSGSVQFGMGEKEDGQGLRTIDAGGYALMPANEVHYLRTSGEAVVQRTAVGPFRTTYVRAGDDPRRIK